MPTSPKEPKKHVFLKNLTFFPRVKCLGELGPIWPKEPSFLVILSHFSRNHILGPFSPNITFPWSAFAFRNQVYVRNQFSLRNLNPFAPRNQVTTFPHGTWAHLLFKSCKLCFLGGNWGNLIHSPSPKRSCKSLSSKGNLFKEVALKLHFFSFVHGS